MCDGRLSVRFHCSRNFLHFDLRCCIPKLSETMVLCVAISGKCYYISSIWSINLKVSISISVSIICLIFDVPLLGLVSWLFEQMCNLPRGSSSLILILFPLFAAPGPSIEKSPLFDPVPSKIWTTPSEVVNGVYLTWALTEPVEVLKFMPVAPSSPVFLTR